MGRGPWVCSGWLGGVGAEYGRRTSITWIRLVERLVSNPVAACGLRVVAEGDRSTGKVGGDRRCFRCDIVEPVAAVRRMAAATVSAVMEGKRREFRAGAERAAGTVG